MSSLTFLNVPTRFPYHSKVLKPPLVERAKTSLPRRVFPRANLGWQGWQDALFGNPDPYPSFGTISSSFPSTYGHLYLLGFSVQSSSRIYVSMQTSTRNPGTRDAYAISSQALEFKLRCGSERLLIMDMFHCLYGTKFGREGMVGFARELIPADVCRLLGYSPIEVMDIGLKMLKRRKAPLNRAEGGVELFKEMGLRLVGASVEEVEHCLGEDAVQLGGFLFFEKDGIIERVECSVAAAVVYANTARVGCHMERELFQSASVLVKDMLGAFEGKGSVRIKRKESEQALSNNRPDICTPDGTKVWNAADLKADDVIGMTDAELRAVLMVEGVGSRKSEEKMSLLRKVAMIMDEVERRELGIRLAADNEMYGIAAELQRGRSKRGKILARMKEAERDEKWTEVLYLGQELRIMERQIADITAEPGSYNRDLDQDDWYRPNR